MTTIAGDGALDMKRRFGFTLVELLVVIAILAILISVLLPSMAAARRRALRTSCQTRLYEINRAIWEYSVANEDCVPYVESPFTNQGYGDASIPDDQLDPFNRELWPHSLQNLMQPLYLGDRKEIWTCPAADQGWPRNSKPFVVTYRDAGVNQPNGQIDEDPRSYFRQNFGFMDGRPMIEARVHFGDNPIVNAQLYGLLRGTYVRDMVKLEDGKIVGPHDGGINVITREFGVEFRDSKTVQLDLAPNNQSVQF